MPFNGSGTFVSIPAPDFPALPGTTILASSFNANMNDLFTNGLTKCMTRDGQSPPTANIPFGGFKITGLANGVNDTDGATLGQVPGLRGQVGAVDWDTRTSTGIFEATAASLTAPAANFPPTSALGQLHVTAQGATINQLYVIANSVYQRQKLTGVWTIWRPLSTGKNYLNNPSLAIWQDVTTLGVGTGLRYAADMWKTASAGTTYSVAQGAIGTPTISDAPDIPFYQSTVVASVAGAANFCNLFGFVEGVSTLNGKQVTFSFYASAVATRTIAISFLQSFGTGGAPSAQVETACGQVVIATGALVRYSVTFTIPSITGKTIGTNGDDSISIKIWFDAGANFNAQTGSLGQQSGTYLLTGYKLEEGPVMTQYESNPRAIDLSRCQRYYWKGLPCSQLNFPSYVNAAVMSWPVKFPETMKAIPTLGITQPGVVLTNTGAPTLTAATPDGAKVLTTSTAITPNAIITWNPASDFLTADTRY